MHSIKGILIPIGGNEDKGIVENEQYTLDYIEEGILSRIVSESGGVDASIVVIPTASSIPVEVGQKYLDAFQKLGCSNVTILDIRKREDAASARAISLVREADCVWFSGGNQSKITSIIGETKIHKILSKRYINESFVIAGTSAGAMCMSREMITGGRGTEVLTKGVVLMAEGMSFIPKLVIDTHFIRRGRFGRLTEAVARFPDLLGIGLAEDTGLVIKNGNEVEVIGSGMVIIFDGSTLTHNNERILENGTPMTICSLTTHVLSHGDRLIIDKREVVALALEASFI